MAAGGDPSSGGTSLGSTRRLRQSQPLDLNYNSCHPRHPRIMVQAAGYAPKVLTGDIGSGLLGAGDFAHKTRHLRNGIDGDAGCVARTAATLAGGTFQ